MAIPPRTGPVAVLVVHQAFLTAGRHSRPVQLPQQPGEKILGWDAPVKGMGNIAIIYIYLINAISNMSCLNTWKFWYGTWPIY